MLNHIVLHGRLSRDVELRRTQAGVAVATTAIAVDRDVADKDGKRQADFIDLVAWRQTAEHLQRYFTKGKEILVSGRLETRKWQDKEGKTRVQVEVNVDRVDFCGPKEMRAANDRPYEDAGTRIATEPAAPRNDSYGGGYGGTGTTHEGHRPSPTDGYAPIDDEDGGLPF